MASHSSTILNRVTADLFYTLQVYKFPFDEGSDEMGKCLKKKKEQRNQRPPTKNISHLGGEI